MWTHLTQIEFLHADWLTSWVFMESQNEFGCIAGHPQGGRAEKEVIQIIDGYGVFRRSNHLMEVICYEENKLT